MSVVVTSRAGFRGATSQTTFRSERIFKSHVCCFISHSIRHVLSHVLKRQMRGKIRVSDSARHRSVHRHRQFQIPMCVCGGKPKQKKKTSCDSESDDQRFRVQSSNESEQLRPLHEWNFILLKCVRGEAMAGTGDSQSLNNSVFRMIKNFIYPKCVCGEAEI